MFLRLQNVILEMIARGEALRSIMDRLCLEVEAIVPGTVCSILTLDEAQRIHPLSGPTLPTAFSAAFDGAPIGPNAGSCGTAAFLGESIAVRDVRADPKWSQVDISHLPAELVACWSSPIFDARHRVVGTFAFYFRENRGPAELEEQIVETCTQLCAIAIERDAQKLEHYRLAFTDTLTGLANRAAFNRAMSALQQDHSGIRGLLLIDLDNLKKVNDTFGHPCGDRLIASAAQSITAVVPMEQAFRISGDEFAVIARCEDGARSLTALAEKILDALKMPIEYLGHAFVRSATMGGAVLGSKPDVDLAKRNADLALYHAKEAGRGRFVMYEDGLGTSITRRLNAIRLVSDALKQDRIEPFYQPIVDLRSGNIIALEALCRIVMNDGTTVPAGEFQDAVTDVLVASELSQRMIARVAQHCRAWLQMNVSLRQVGINITASDIRDGRLGQQLTRVFGEVGVPLSSVAIEITESVYISDPDEVISREISALRKLGVSVALDDFGTGYASLTHLMTVPVDVIKIDKTFIDRMQPDRAPHVPSKERSNITADARIRSDRSGDAIVRGLIAIATDLGIRVVAEGVETALQAAQLRGVGCPFAQGFYFAQPMDYRSMADLLGRTGTRSAS
jgi:diguanylate cyclase (GGDEF)-like protein